MGGTTRGGSRGVGRLVHTFVVNDKFISGLCREMRYTLVNDGPFFLQHHKIPPLRTMPLMNTGGSLEMRGILIYLPGFAKANIQPCHQFPYGTVVPASAKVKASTTQAHSQGTSSIVTTPRIIWIPLYGLLQAEAMVACAAMCFLDPARTITTKPGEARYDLHINLTKLPS